jgi:predicted CopG family antitoxin
MLYSMAKRIALSQQAYERLKKEKMPGESFSDVVLREIPERCETAGEILDYFDSRPVPRANPKLVAAMRAGRGRRSNRKFVGMRKAA